MTQPHLVEGVEGVEPSRLAELSAAYSAVRQRIDAGAEAAGRDPHEVALLAVSKTRPAVDVLALLTLGQHAFGESRHQEALAKAARVAGAVDAAVGATGTSDQPGAPPVQWHMVGRLQTNKTRVVAGWADVVHGVDRVDLLAGLGRGVAERGASLDVYVQVSLDGDPRRGGVLPTELARLADAVVATPALVLRGVMAVAVRELPARSQFARLRELSALVTAQHPGAGQISAGMSGDLEDAIAEGATLVRVGTALFGVRPPVLR